MFPNYINTNEFEYLKVNEKYIASSVIVKYPKRLIYLNDIIPDNIRYINVIIIKKKDTYKTLKEISYNLSSSKASIKDIGYSRIDYDVIDKYNNDMLNLRKDIQINLEEVYDVYNIISISSDSKVKLLNEQKSLKAKLYSKDFSIINLNFRQLEGYISSVFTNYLDSSLNNYHKLLTSSNLVSMFPFVTKNIIDENGILLGKSSFSEIVILDMFKDIYLNSNMCIFGSSRNRKVFFY